MKTERKNNITNIFYAVIGVSTLMIAIIGATFAYYTATSSNNNTIKGNMATIGFDVTVTKVLKQDETRGGLIPMSNNMIEQALTKNAAVSGKGICVDDNGNAVCQIYKITVVNNSTSSIFVDGYVTLNGGSGVAEDIPTGYTAGNNTTTMRWAQVFCSAETSGTVSNCTTAGNSTVRSDSTVSLAALGGTTVKNDGTNEGEILTTRTAIATDSDSEHPTIKNNKYEVINKNYIRLSNHTYGNYSYTRDNDPTSALVFNQYLDANDNNVNNNTGNSSSTYADAQVYYILVWLSENGHNQTAGATGASTKANEFFQGSTTFISAQGNEVTATFSGHLRVDPNTPITQ